MSTFSIARLRERAEEPMTQRGIEILVGVALAVWVFGQLVFSYSTFAQVYRISLMDISKFHQAIAAGCLIAAVASKNIRLRPAEIVAIFVALFATLTVWRRGGDTRPVILLLFLIVSTDLDLSRLARFFVAGAILAFILVLGVAAIGRSATRFAITEGSLTSAYGFDRPETLAFALLGTLGALPLGWKKQLSWTHFYVLCLVGAVTTLLVLHQLSVTVLMVGLACIVALPALRPTLPEAATQSTLFRWAMALLPVALFFIINDGAKFYNLPFPKGGFTNCVGAYGFLVPALIAGLHVRTLITHDDQHPEWLEMALPIPYMLAFIVSINPLFLEFNCTLLLLARGVSPSAADDDAAADDSEPAVTSAAAHMRRSS